MNKYKVILQITTNHIYMVIVLFTFVFGLMAWKISHQSLMVPLISDIRMVDTVKAMDVLALHDIHTEAKLADRILWVKAEQKNQARAALATIGIE